MHPNSPPPAPLATSSGLHRAATATTSLAAQAAAALHATMDDQACMPTDQDHDLDLEDALDSFIMEDTDVCSAPTSLATLRSAPAVPAKEGRRKETSQGQTSSSCAAELPKAVDEEEGPDTPASAEKQASIIIRYGCHRPGQQCCVCAVATLCLASGCDSARRSVDVGHEQLNCIDCCLLNISMACLNLLLHAFAADTEGQPCPICQANKAAVSCTDI